MPANEPWAEGDPDDPRPARTGPVEAIRDAIPTSRHARMLFDMVVQLVGERAVVESAGGGTAYRLLLRDSPGSESIVPWPLLQFGAKGRLSFIFPILGPGEAPPRPGAPPRLRGLGPAEIVIHDGLRSITVTYGDDGRWIETAHSEDPGTLAGALPVLARRTARPVELLAEFVASLDPACLGPGRVLCPAPLPAAEGAWVCGLRAIRDALFDGRVPSDARWVAADGYEGTAIGWGATREDALDLFRAGPRPTPPAPAPPCRPGKETLEDGGIALRGASADGIWPEAVPAAIVPLEPSRTSPSRWGRSMRIVGGFGGTMHALFRREPSGFTLVGEEALRVVDLDGLDGLLEGIEPFDHPELEAARQRRREGPAPDCRTIVYRVMDERTGFAVVPSLSEASLGHGFRGHMLDGDRLRFRVLRHRRIG